MESLKQAWTTINQLGVTDGSTESYPTDDAFAKTYQLRGRTIRATQTPCKQSSSDCKGGFRYECTDAVEQQLYSGSECRLGYKPVACISPSGDVAHCADGSMDLAHCLDDAYTMVRHYEPDCTLNLNDTSRHEDFGTYVGTTLDKVNTAGITLIGTGLLVYALVKPIKKLCDMACQSVKTSLSKTNVELLKSKGAEPSYTSLA